MIPLARPLALVAGLLMPVFASAQSDSPPSAAAKKIEEIAKNPGIYHQACLMMRPEAPLVVKVSFSGRSSRSEYEVSAAQYAELRAMRAEAVEALEAWLRRPLDVKEDEETAWKMPQRSRLTMIVDLNAASLLPLLKKHAEHWKKVYDAASTATEVDWEAYGKMEAKEREAIDAKMNAEGRLGDILSAIVTVLRQEKFEPLLSSTLEKELEAMLEKAKAKVWHRSMADRIEKNGGKPDAKDRDMVLMDLVLGEHFTVNAYGKIQLKPEQIGEILDWVDEHAKLPEEKKRHERGMHDWPVNR
jgi:hypothetical protein